MSPSATIRVGVTGRTAYVDLVDAEPTLGDAHRVSLSP
jgi:hypothetical protein